MQPYIRTLVEKVESHVPDGISGAGSYHQRVLKSHSGSGGVSRSWSNLFCHHNKIACAIDASPWGKTVRLSSVRLSSDWYGASDTVRTKRCALKRQVCPPGLGCGQRAAVSIRHEAGCPQPAQHPVGKPGSLHDSTRGRSRLRRSTSRSGALRRDG